MVFIGPALYNFISLIFNRFKQYLAENNLYLIGKSFQN